MSLYRQGKVPGSFYDGYGQEAVSAGAAFAMGPKDRLCILHRDLAAHLIRGVTPARILSQYMGRAAGITHGRDGNVHFGDRNLGCVGMVSMLPDMMLVATGMAMAFKLRGEQALRADLVRRRLDLARRLPRGDELGGRAEAAGHLRAREQPVRVLDAGRQAVRGRPGGARRRLRVRRGHRRRQRRRGDVRGHPCRARARARRRGADADRGGDDADARPRRPRRHEVRAQGAGRGVAQARPDRAPGGPAERARRRRRRAPCFGEGGDRRGRRRGARRPDARSGDRARRRVLRGRGRAARRRPGAVERLSADGGAA